MTPENKQLPNRGTGKRSKKARTQNVIKNKSNWFHSVYSTRLALNVLYANVALIWHSKASSVHLSNCRLNKAHFTPNTTLVPFVLHQFTTTALCGVSFGLEGGAASLHRPFACFVFSGQVTGHDL